MGLYSQHCYSITCLSSTHQNDIGNRLGVHFHGHRRRDLLRASHCRIQFLRGLLQPAYIPSFRIQGLQFLRWHSSEAQASVWVWRNDSPLQRESKFSLKFLADDMSEDNGRQFKKTLVEDWADLQEDDVGAW